MAPGTVVVYRSGVVPPGTENSSATVGTPEATPPSSLPATFVQLAAAVESDALQVAIERRNSRSSAVVGAEVGMGKPIGTASPSARTFCILLRSPMNIHGSLLTVGRCGTRARGSPL